MGKAFFSLFTIVLILGAIIWTNAQKTENSKNEAVQNNAAQDFSAPPEFKMEIFAQGLGTPRDLEFSPGGVLLVSIPSQGKVLAIRDGSTKEILGNLERPHGLAFYKGKLFVAEETRIVRYNWDENNLQADRDKILFDLPMGGRHFTRTIAFNKDGQMFVSIGSTCDVCFEEHPWHGTVIVSNSEGRDPRVFAKGLRNAVFIAIHPQTNELWGTEMGRDFLGNDLPPDEVNVIKEGKDYGWPVCYGDKVYDEKFGQRSPSYCENTESPIFEIAAHSAPLGLAFIDSEQFPREWQGDLLVAYHGSWNRSTPIGYKVVQLEIENGRVVRESDFLTGFLKNAEVLGRPVDLIFDKEGNLFVSDDGKGVIFKVSRK